MIGSMLRKAQLSGGCAANNKPDATTGVVATALSTSSVDVQWDADATASPNEATFWEVERSPNGSTGWAQVGVVNTNQFIDAGLSPNTTYWYRVIAGNCYDKATASATASAKTQNSGLSPSWSLDFSSGSFSGATLTRASSGTYVDSSGYIASASTDVARLTHNSSGTRLGLLVEEQRTNICPTSETTTGVASNTAVTTSNTGPAPDNTNTAELMSEVVANGTHHCGPKDSSANVDLDSLYVYSVFLKRPASNATQYAVVTFLYRTSDRRFSQVFDLSAGSTSGCATRSRNTPVDTSSGIEAYANGWYRCWVSHRSRSTNENLGGQGIVQFSDSATPATWVVDTYPSYNVTSAKDMLVWGHQIEKGATPSAYISNTGTGSTTRSADLAHVLDSSITSWGDPGALVVHFYPPGQAGTLLSTDDMANEQLGIQASTTTAARAFWSSGSTSTGTIAAGVNKAVHYWNGTNSRFCINGGTVQTGTNNITTFGNIDFVTFGAEATESGGVPVPPPPAWQAYANCIIRKIEFYSGTLTDANLQTITT